MLKRIANKKLWLSFVMIAVLAVSLAGCASGQAITPAGTGTPAASSTSVTAPQDTVSRAVTAWSKLTSYQYDISMGMNMSGTVSGQSANSNITITGNGANNVTTRQMQMNMDLDIDAPGQGKMTLPMVYYLVDGWQYTKVSVPMAGDQWVKIKVDMNSYDAKDDITHALQLLQSAVKVNQTGTENVNGTACYVFDVNPDLTQFSQWLKSAQSSTNVAGNVPDVDLSKSVKNLSIKVYVAQDSNLLKKSVITANVTLNGTDLGVAGQAGDSLNMDISQTMTMTQYNQPVTITLPPEAQNAHEVTLK